jgi:uncharacterized protein (TIGR03437 family)
MVPGWKAGLFCSVALWAAGDLRDSPARLTPAPAGPYHVSGNRILDAHGRAYLARGTVLPEATLDIVQIQGEGGQFGVYSPSSFVTIRQRLNMNAVRLPVNAALYVERPDYRARIRDIVQRANQFELLPILAADSGGVAFWSRCAAEFKNNPNLFFAPDDPALVETIRVAGAAQPILVAGPPPELPVRGPNIIYQVTPSYVNTRTEEDRRVQFGLLADRAPVLVNDFDPQLDRKSPECEAFPADPTDATKLVEENLDYFDAHRISWTLSSFRPSRMLTEYRTFSWSKLDDGWTCGVSPTASGIAMILLAHLWNADVHGLLAVGSPHGGLVIARGAIATAYGQVLAERQMDAPWGRQLPLALGNVSVRVTDSRGVARLAPLLYTAAGWGHITYLVPANSATGPAEVAVVRTDGSSSRAKVIVADVAPGFWTATDDGRGPVIAKVTQWFSDGSTKTYPAWECASHYACRAIPIPLAKNVTTIVRLEGAGIRHAPPNAAIRVTVGDVHVPVLSFGPADDRGRDQITIKLPDQLRGMGETDLFATVNGALSNVVRIHCGALE